jgi:hypothetical protein
MNTKEKYVSSITAVLMIAVLCVVSYRLGARHSAEKYADRMSALTAGSTTGSDAEFPSAAHSASLEEIEPVPGTDAAAAGIQDEIAAEQRERLMRNIADNLAMPEMNEMIRQQQRVLMADKYRSLIKTLGLSPQEETYLMDLLTARQMLQVDFGMKLMTGMLSGAERAELMEKLGADMEELQKEIDWFLNSQTDSDYFRYYDKTEGERATVASVGSAVKQAGNPFDEGVEEELVAILYEELTRYPFSVNLEENGEPVFSNYTDANIDIFLQELEQLRGPVFNEAASILDPDQLEIFEAYYAQYIAFYEQRLRMAQQFFNSDP